jgi:hypothetical protein
MPFNRFRHPEGTRLPAFERNILKYRGFEMLLLLFYAEQLREMIVGTIRATDRWTNKGSPRIDPSTKNKFKVAVAALVSDGILSNDESKEISNLVDVRNIIAHEVHKMTFDVSRDSWSRAVVAAEKSRYDHTALERIKHLQNELERRMKSRYVRELSLDSLLFKSAETTYKGELISLKRKIDAQYSIRRGKLAELKHELSLKETEFADEESHPAHPASLGRNGNLTKRGVEICFRLFDLGKSPMAVAYLMYISVRAARARHKQWLKSRGNDRQRRQLS